MVDAGPFRNKLTEKLPNPDPGSPGTGATTLGHRTDQVVTREATGAVKIGQPRCSQNVVAV